MPVKKPAKKSAKAKKPQVQAELTVQPNHSWKGVVIGLGVFLIMCVLSFSFLVAMIVMIGGDVDGSPSGDGNIALIPIYGAIQVGSPYSGFQQGVSSNVVTKFIKEADEDDEIDAILLDINSPGGTAVASEEIANAINNCNKTVVAVIREVGASGGYWIAASTDRIFASESSITGSIGVISSYIEFAGIMDKYNLTYQRLVAGKYKDAGSPLRRLLPEEKANIQVKLDKMHALFIESVASSRNMPEAKVKALATGDIYIGSEALEVGLIDQIGDRNTAVKWIEDELGIEADLAMYQYEPSFVDLFGSVMSNQFYNLGRGIGDSFKADTKSGFYTQYQK